MSRAPDHRPRILAGRLRGRALWVPEGQATRPLRALVRRSLFDQLGARLDGATFLDLYAGAGGVGYEAASRGAGHVVLVERAREPLAALERSRRELGLEDVVTLEPCDAAEFAARVPPRPFDVIFAGPPYRMFRGTERAALEDVLDAVPRLLARRGLLVLEAPTGASTPQVPGLNEVRARDYGETSLRFLERPEPPDSQGPTDGATIDPASQSFPEARGSAPPTRPWTNRPDTDA